MTELTVESPMEIAPLEERVEALAAELGLAVYWHSPCILLALYNSEFVRADAETLLENQLMDLGQEIAHIQLTDKQGSHLFEVFRGYDGYEGRIFFVQGLRWGNTGASDLYENLNREREFFRDESIRVVFWLTQNEYLDLAHRAPDFWSRRHCVIEFVESPTPGEVMQQAIDSAWQGTGEYAGLYDDTDEKIMLRESLLTGIPSGEEASSIRANLLLTLGLLNWRKGDFEKADEQLSEALKLASKIQDNWFEAECFNAMALVKTSMERIDEAIHAYKQAIRLAPEQIFAWNNLGNLCTRIGRNDEAIVTFLKAIECNPQDAIAWNGLGDVYFKIGYADDAIAAFRKSIQFLPSFAHPWNGLADVYAHVGRSDEAIKAYQKAIELNGQFITPWLHMAELFSQQERHRDAVRAYQRALQLDGRNADIWNELGKVYCQTAAWQDAEEAFLKSIEMDRGQGWAHSNLGQVYAQQGKLGESIPMLTRSIELLKDDKEKATAWNRLGNVYRQMNDYDNAMAAYQMADLRELGTSRAPVCPMPETASGSDLADTETQAPPAEAETRAGTEPVQSSASEAASENMESGEAQPKIAAVDTPDWLFQPVQEEESGAADTADPALQALTETGGMSMCFWKLRKPKKNESKPVEETETQPEQAEETRLSASAWNEKGNASFREGAYEDAISAYQQAIQLEPTFGWPYSNLALTYLAQGRQAEAILLYQKGIALVISDKEKALCWNGLGNAHRSLNDYASAIAAYQKAAELDPETAGMRDTAETPITGPGFASAKVWNDLGEIFLKTGVYGEAATAFSKAIQLDPGFGWPYSNLGRTLASQGKHAQAIPYYQKSIELLQDRNDKAVSWNRLGNTYRKLNDYDNAIKAFQAAIALNDEGMDLVTRTRFSLLSNCYAD